MINLTKQFIKFCLVGFTNLSIHLFLFFLLTRFAGLHYVFASIIAFIIAVSWSFLVNKKWTFRKDDNNHKEQYLKFFIANIIAFIINVSLLSFFIEILHLYDILAQLVASVICAFINFAINRFWTFKDES